jgi:sugar transferase EpsL
MIKRIVEVNIAILLLIILSPIMIVVSILIRITMGKGIIFRQLRPGLNAEIFNMYKFRTMEHNKTDDTKTEKERITKIGAFLRSSSIDELPELINVLKGEMSFVGPRPLLVEYLEKYTEKEKKRHNVKPGITGLAQVRGRNELSWKNKFRYDVFYVEHQSFILDIKILIETIKVIVLKEGFKLVGESKKFGSN